MQSQPNRQEPLSYNGAHPPSVPDPMAAGFSQSAIPHNNTQSLAHGQTAVPGIEPELGRRNDIYRGDAIPGFEFNNSMTGSWEAPVPPSQPLGHNLTSGYTAVMPSVQYSHGNVGQGHGRASYGSQYGFTPSQFPADPTVPYLFSGAYTGTGSTAPNNQESFPGVWRLHNVWVGYAMQDELHVTIAFRRIRSA